MRSPYKHYNTISELVAATKSNITDLHSIVDVLLSGYRTASEILDQQVDHRQKYIDQLRELNDTLSDIVEVHPALKNEKIYKDVFAGLVNIAYNDGISAKI